ncbi:uncharacterized protein METZ01_LOCUS506504, partial [marine metagenome]
DKATLKSTSAIPTANTFLIFISRLPLDSRSDLRLSIMSFSTVFMASASVPYDIPITCCHLDCFEHLRASRRPHRPHVNTPIEVY